MNFIIIHDTSISIKHIWHHRNHVYLLPYNNRRKHFRKQNQGFSSNVWPYSLTTKALCFCWVFAALFITMCALKLFGAHCPMRCHKIWRGPKEKEDVFSLVLYSLRNVIEGVPCEIMISLWNILLRWEYSINVMLFSRDALYITFYS